MEINTSSQSSLPPVFSTPTPAGSPSVAPVPPVAPSRGASTSSSLLKTIIIILLVLLLVGAGLLAFYFYNEYRVARSDVDAQISVAVLKAEQELTDRLETEFAEREKEPYRTFTGPEEYGSLSFKYPQTWSAYISHYASGSSSSGFQAYLHPGEVQPVSSTTITALRVSIQNETFETASKRYESYVGKTLVATPITVNGQDAMRYDGTFSNKLVGSVVIFRIRDKVVTLQTDAEIYRSDFAKILESITYNL